MGRPGNDHHTKGKILKETVYLLGKGEGKIQKKKHTLIQQQPLPNICKYLLLLRESKLKYVCKIKKCSDECTIALGRI